MASVLLGPNKVAPTALAMPDAGVVALKMGFANLYLDSAEADQLAAELQRAAQALRIGNTTAKQYTDALSSKPDASGTANAHGRNITVTADSGASLSLTHVEAKELAESLVDAAAAIEEGATDCVSIDQRRRLAIPQEAAA